MFTGTGIWFVRVHRWRLIGRVGLGLDWIPQWWEFKNGRCGFPVEFGDLGASVWQ